MATPTSFGSQAGSLDHSMANANLLPQISGATTWHINADEPTVLDYNVEFKNDNQQNILYYADPYRTSDHDPLLIGLNLTPSVADRGQQDRQPRPRLSGRHD